MLCRSCLKLRQTRATLRLAPSSQLISAARSTPLIQLSIARRLYASVPETDNTTTNDAPPPPPPPPPSSSQIIPNIKSAKPSLRKRSRPKNNAKAANQTSNQSQSATAKPAPSQEASDDAQKSQKPKKAKNTADDHADEHTMKAIHGSGDSGMPAISRGFIKESQVKFTAMDVETDTVPGLSYGLDRVLFNPGVYHLQDPRSLVYNFDPYLGSIMPVKEFDFSALNEYITSSKDETLRQYAKKEGRKYIGSSSSMTSVLSQFHFLLSNWREINTSFLSQGFRDNQKNFTRLSRAPSAIFLRHKDGAYAIDADKEFDTGNILMHLGKSMEKLLTVPTEEFERYRKTSAVKVDPDQVDPEVYHYSTCGDFLMRSQLDAHDPRLPGTGMFDLKTRAVVSIRMDAQNHEEGMGYQIKGRFGNYESFEREYFDMIRAAFLKYSLQARIGRMDGIFVAFHNIKRIFGFQYLSLSEMDTAIHGQANTSLGDREFRLSLGLWNKILDKATEQFPGQPLRMHFETRDTSSPFMYIFAEPMTDAEIDEIQTKNQKEIEELSRKLLNSDEEMKAAVEQEVNAEREVEDQNEIRETTEANEGATAAEVAGSDSNIIASGSMEPSNMSDFQPDNMKTVENDPSAQPPSSSESATSDDVESSSTSSSSDSERPLLAMILSIKNKVNGEFVERPMNLKGFHKWEVKYELRKFNDQARARKFYEMCKTRRQKELDKNNEEGTGKANYFQTQLKKISARGDKWRAKLDQMEQAQGVVTLKDS